MAKFDIITIEDKIQQLLEDGFDQASFIYEFLSFYDIPKATITRIRKDKSGEIKNKLYYKSVPTDKSVVAGVAEIEEAIKDKKSQPRYIIVTNFVDFAAKDTKTSDTLQIPFRDLPTYADFFLAWNGVEKVDYAKENPADIKAAERFTRLYDELKKINHFDDRSQEEKEFNLFLIRLLFLLFAEDTEIMKKGIFTNAIKTRSREDGSDLNTLFNHIFASLDIAVRFSQESWLQEFPYVNGKLFTDASTNLVFDKKTRKLILEAGELLNWNEINPDILGAMIQTVASSEHRSSSGMHYTSVENIMKVIKPLFLDELTANYQTIVDKINENEDKDTTERTKRENRTVYQKELTTLHERLSKIKFFDPACGSGNFLIITYKELRRLEIKLLKALRELRQDGRIDFFETSKISLNQFYGIELDDFAHEVARLSLWIAEYQMNLEALNEINLQSAFLPLRDAGNITQGNALRLDWDRVVPHAPTDEIYLIGNPPYIGAVGKKGQSLEQKEDLRNSISPIIAKKIDYIFGWFVKGSRFIEGKNASLSFVTTNSIFQGEQVAFFSTHVLANLEIRFAYPSFKWSNSAKGNAGVTVAIVGLQNPISSPKYLYENGSLIEVPKINAYLRTGEDYRIEKRRQTLSKLPNTMTKGSAELGKDNLFLSIDERNKLLLEYPNAEKFLKKIINATDLMNGTFSYAIWIEDHQVDEAKRIPEFASRIEAVRQVRTMTKGVSAKSVAETPWRFGQIKHKELPALVLPVHSSESREYIPVDYLDAGIITTNANCVLFDAPIWLVGVLGSKMHLCWLREVGGKLDSRFRYSADLVYNTFPIPELSERRKAMLEEAVLDMFDVREEEGGTLAQLYGGANKPMNARLKEAHLKIDEIVERAYKSTPFTSDEERTNHLIKLYKEMTECQD
ncbi:Type II restriction enzyme%2C methylase subunit YeeA [Streptococcus suis]|uniref:site-specific DNA-methyltransferase (adenine-specific) n=1 Tax=Streptococcus suis TaxID=1307 RepID=A0A0Z8FX15_STRSU|nr:DNA methyltransferase [Streptococcus suis]NQH35413.1 class I SAM-dependent DNA methyltransferase [Streptococcus suis]CYU88046.1 Type II restriction enzyme%2C methylase subunit YeeA [Streptococcus suis]